MNQLDPRYVYWLYAQPLHNDTLYAFYGFLESQPTNEAAQARVQELANLYSDIMIKQKEKVLIDQGIITIPSLGTPIDGVIILSEDQGKLILN